MARPLLVPIADLRRRVGTRRTLQYGVEAAAVGQLDGVAGTSVPPHQEIQLDLVIESVLEGVTVSGTLRAPWQADCRRCLEPVTGEVEIEVQELFETKPTLGETYLLEADHIDLEPLVRDAVLLALPLSVVCADDCAGPDPERFPATVESDDEPEPPSDPRWSALGELHFED